MVGIGVFAVMVIVVAVSAGAAGFVVGRGRAAVAREQARTWRESAEQMRRERDAVGEQSRRERDAGVEQLLGERHTTTLTYRTVAQYRPSLGCRRLRPRRADGFGIHCVVERENRLKCTVFRGYAMPGAARVPVCWVDRSMHTEPAPADLERAIPSFFDRTRGPGQCRGRRASARKTGVGSGGLWWRRVWLSHACRSRGGRDAAATPANRSRDSRPRWPRGTGTDSPDRTPQIPAREAPAPKPFP